MNRYARCSACGESRQCTQQKVYPDRGWILPFEMFGYYGGFSDQLDILFEKRISAEWIMCHDCVVKLLRTFPLLAETFGNDHHESPDDSPCCEFSCQRSEEA
jgi:hypothetical protein